MNIYLNNINNDGSNKKILIQSIKRDDYVTWTEIGGFNSLEAWIVSAKDIL